MDGDKKKKNKKKKNKQNKTTESVTFAGSGETPAAVDHSSHVSETADYRNGDDDADVRKPDGDLDQHRINETKGSVLAEAEKQKWLNREASLEETIKQLQSEKELCIQKEAGLEARIVQLESEKESWLLKEVSLEERISQLLDDKAILSSKGANLEERIGQLLDEKAILSSKGASLEERIVQLLDEKTILSSKGASLEKKIEQLRDENAILSSERANVDERIKQVEREQDSWALKENSTKEIIASLNYENTRLRMQVMEAEESRNKIFQENQLLMENISSLHSQIQGLEITCSARSSTETTKASENEDLNSQMEAARSLVEKLVTENAELVEKVNELYIELDWQSVTAGLPSAVGSVPVPVHNSVETVTVADITPEPSEVSVSDKRMESLEAVPIQNGMVNGDNMMSDITTEIVNFSETDRSGEIVQIPLYENEVQDIESQAAGIDEKPVVPISDAPLIGAPFRFISFVAKYVSGADLVNKSSTNSGH